MHVTDLLTLSGHESFLVGGCVRDHVRGVQPKDYDVATSALPQEVLRIMKEAGLTAFPIGLEHGTVGVIDPTIGDVEITTYRVDGEYSDGRHPTSVHFTDKIEHDLARRDFTINAMAMDPVTGEIRDPFGGKKDLSGKLIRCVGDPLKRFTEDGLRPIRAARFASQLGFTVHYDTGKYIENEEVRSKIALVSKERIRDEILKAMSGTKPSAFWVVLRKYRALDFVVSEMNEMYGLPQNDNHHLYDVWKHSLETADLVAEAGGDALSVLAASLHDLGKTRTLTMRDDGKPQFLGHDTIGVSMVHEILKRLKFSKDEQQYVESIVKHHMIYYDPGWSNSAVRRWIHRVGEDMVDDLIVQRRADLAAHGLFSKRVSEFEEFVRRVKDQQESVAKPAVNGHDLIKIGYSPGSELGKTLDCIQEYVLEHPEDNTKERLLELVASKTFINP